MKKTIFTLTLSLAIALGATGDLTNLSAAADFEWKQGYENEPLSPEPIHPPN
ncbi:hypothetical protein [Halalkalibacter alkalisediminis]|uniref:Uncharacterized protein n=1 Tax=Halalkalibacter alkalisediminis TaxID=935616 RepID=A0ABV6NFD8_9BACI|nr:hypothetical protein [Halalkalibacter alkalisediminis]